ncbi:hypothetical protein ABPG74_004701 [Tetrahymena malaccensis]
MRSLTVFILLIITIANVTAATSQKVDQCTNTASNSISTICSQNDTDCQNSLQKMGACLIQCASGTDQSDSYVLNCAKTTCTTTNQTLQTWLNKYLTCLHLSKLSFSILLLALFALVF